MRNSGVRARVPGAAQHEVVRRRTGTQLFPNQNGGPTARRFILSLSPPHPESRAQRGCPERICQRNRGCMAPNIHCSNVELPSPEQQAEDWPKVQFEVRTALNKILAERAAEVEAYEEEELQRVLAKRRQGKPAEG